jgi:enoyl-CoA hydratase
MVDTGSEFIKLTVEGELATITVSRPEKLNALTLDGDSGVRVAIITATGDRAFCAGGDVNEWSKVKPEDFGLQWVRIGHRAFDALTRLRQPLIAALNGHALGGGLELAACADFRVGEAQIKIGLPETGIGIIPGWSGTQRCVKRFGSQIVRRMSVLGEILTADQALGSGVIDRLVSKGSSVAAAHEMALSITSRSSFATSSAKMMINAADGEDAERALEALAGIGTAHSPELQKGLQNFRNKTIKS